MLTDETFLEEYRTGTDNFVDDFVITHLPN